MSDKMTVEVVYASENKQLLLEVSVEVGATAWEAVKQSGVDKHFEEIELNDPSQLSVGVFSKKIKDIKSYQVKSGDRLEIYRCLKVDPKQLRRTKAKKRI